MKHWYGQHRVAWVRYEATSHALRLAPRAPRRRNAERVPVAARAGSALSLIPRADEETLDNSLPAVAAPESAPSDNASRLGRSRRCARAWSRGACVSLHLDPTAVLIADEQRHPRIVEDHTQWHTTLILKQSSSTHPRFDALSGTQHLAPTIGYPQKSHDI